MSQNISNEPELSVLLPTFNEADIILNSLKVLADTLGKDFTQKCEVIITDDGKDSLPEVVQSESSKFGFFKVIVMRNSPPVGKGRSLAFGFKKARGAIVGFLDVDFSTHPRYILKAIDSLKLNQCDVFIASRKLKMSKVIRKQSWIKNILGTLYLKLNQFLFFEKNQYFSDTQCGFKFFKNQNAKILYHDLFSHDGLADLEVLIRSQFLGLKVHEEPVDWVDERESKRALSKILKNEIPSILQLFYQYVLRRQLNKKTLLEYDHGKNIKLYQSLSG